MKQKEVKTIEFEFSEEELELLDVSVLHHAYELGELIEKLRKENPEIMKNAEKSVKMELDGGSSAQDLSLSVNPQSQAPSDSR